MYQPCQDAASATSHHSRQCLEPIVNILSGLILGDAVPLLDLAFQLVTTSIAYVEVGVPEIAPLLFDLALNLFPVSFNSVPIHEIPPVSFDQKSGGRRGETAAPISAASFGGERGRGLRP